MSSDIRSPTEADIRSISDAYGMDLTDEEIEAFVNLVPFLMESYEQIDDAQPSHSVSTRQQTARNPGSHPSADGDEFNAWISRCCVEGADDGLLDGCEIGLKDNIALAGYPMTCGYRGLEDYIPKSDATIVGRLLEAGATITGKTNMDAMAFASSGETSFSGPISNPAIPGYLAGGSSGGSAAAVAAGDVDVALGTDQAGSIRIPASFCGVTGLKPTHGLVPYTGIVGQGYTFDHVGPIAQSVELCARTLSVIAGLDTRDGELLDPRQSRVSRSIEMDQYEAALNSGDRITVGVLEEGFGRRASEAAVDETVSDAIDTVAENEAIDVETCSVPMHRLGMHVWACVIAEANAALVTHNGVGHFVQGWYDESFAAAFSKATETAAAELSASMQLTLIVGQYMADRYDGRFHAKGQNLRHSLRQAYDKVLTEVDVLALPTTPITAFEKQEDPSTMEIVERAYGGVENTSPFDMTGHPAISLPCGTTDEGLPVGLMLVAERFDESTLLRTATQVEQVLSRSTKKSESNQNK